MSTSYWRMSPEVAGELANGTQMDTTVHPPRVTRLHHRLEGWLGDDIIECFPCFVVTERLAKLLESSGLTGFQLDQVETCRSPEFTEMYPDRQLPDFRWLKVTAVQPEEADFRLADDHRLEVSDAALAVLRSVRMDHADLEKASHRTAGPT